jgi:Uma2 family endonuclease
MTIAAPGHRFTVSEYYRMVDAGILTEDDRVELIDGEIVDMAATGPRHAACVTRVTRLLEDVLPREVTVRVQSPLHLGEHAEPEPDLVLVPYRDDFYSTAHPGADEALLVIEVADASLHYDEQVKSLLYARAGVAEFWLVDLVGQRVIVYRRPDPAGYRSVVSITGAGTVGPLGFPSVSLTAAEILG